MAKKLHTDQTEHADSSGAAGTRQSDGVTSPPRRSQAQARIVVAHPISYGAELSRSIESDGLTQEKDTRPPLNDPLSSEKAFS